MLEVIEQGKDTAFAHMARDRRMLEEGNSGPRLTFYIWNSFCITYGLFAHPEKFLSIDFCKKEGIEVIQRPTGGGVFFHESDVPFSLFLPAKHALSFDATWEGIQKSLVKLLLPSFPEIHEAESHLYPNKLKNWDFSDAEHARFDSEKIGPLSYIGAVFSGSKMACSAKEKTNSSACLGIKPIEGRFCQAQIHGCDFVWGEKKFGGAAFRKSKQGTLAQASLFCSPLSWDKSACFVKQPEVLQVMKQVSMCLGVNGKKDLQKIITLAIEENV